MVWTSGIFLMTVLYNNGSQAYNHVDMLYNAAIGSNRLQALHYIWEAGSLSDLLCLNLS